MVQSNPKKQKEARNHETGSLHSFISFCDVINANFLNAQWLHTNGTCDDTVLCLFVFDTNNF
jgi:hypothetical protein